MRTLVQLVPRSLGSPKRVSEKEEDKSKSLARILSFTTLSGHYGILDGRWGDRPGLPHGWKMGGQARAANGQTKKLLSYLSLTCLELMIMYDLICSLGYYK